MGLQSIQRPKRRYNSYQGTIGKIADNLLKRYFKADKPNQKWVTDVTEFKVNNDKLYLSPIVDLFNGEVISFNLSRQPVFAQVVDMLEKAFSKIPDNTNLILHSDQGWQYQMKQYQWLLKDKGIRQSMSRKGNCLDNSLVENFFGLLKSELFYMKEYKTIEELAKIYAEKGNIEYYDIITNGESTDIDKKKQIEEFIEEHIEKDVLDTEKLSLTSEEDFEKLILAYDLSTRKNSKYKTLEEDAETIEKNGYRYPALKFVRRHL